MTGAVGQGDLTGSGDRVGLVLMDRVGLVGLGDLADRRHRRLGGLTGRHRRVGLGGLGEPIELRNQTRPADTDRQGAFFVNPVWWRDLRSRELRTDPCRVYHVSNIKGR
jgi:hypothetical protein